MERVKLGEICEIVSGSTPKTGVTKYWDGDINWITPAELTDETYIIEESQRKITDVAVQETGLRSFPKGTVILSSRAPIGKVAIAGKEMYCNQGFKNLICSEKIDNRYLYWYLKGHTDYLNSLGRGATFKEISKSIVENIEIPLPSLSEQSNCADVLEKCRDLMSIQKVQVKQLDVLIKSRFVEMFGDLDLSSVQREWQPISSIGNVVSGATPKTINPDYWDGTYRWITPAELDSASGYIFDSVRKLTKAGVESCSLVELPVGTVLLSSRAPIGKVAITGNTFYCNQGFKNIVCSDKIHPIFLYTLLWMNTEYLNSLGRGATFKEISKTIVENIMIPVPRIDLQIQFADFFHQVEKLKAVAQKRLEKIQFLFDSLMQQYFG